jgi:hypothetical protein
MNDSARKDVANARRELLKAESMLRSLRGNDSPGKDRLFTLVVACGATSYTTQVYAASAEAAATAYLNDVYPATAAEAFESDAPRLGSGDLIYVAPMDGLSNVWAVSAGRDGKYISVVCTLTEAAGAV